MFLTSLLLGLLLFYGCAHGRPKASAAFYHFEYSGENYRIRSISSTEKGRSYNELIGAKVVATDYDQDRLLDEITLGEMSLVEAQEIYEYALSRLAVGNKLREVSSKINRYQDVNSDYNYEIKSFRSTHGEPFNEFRIITRQLLNPQMMIGIDQKADGVIDEVRQGDMSLERIQAIYAHVIERGLAKKQLIGVDNMILVKTN